MIRALSILLVFAQLSLADVFVKKLTPKDLKPNAKAKPMIVLSGKLQKTCAIRLKVIPAVNGRLIDPISLPSGSRSFDRIARPPSIPACPNR